MTQEPHTFLELFARSRAFVAVLDGASHVVVYANPELRQLFPRADPRVLPLREAFPELVANDLCSLCDRVFATGQGVHIVERPVRVAGEHGELRYFDLDLIPRVDEGGAVIGLLAYGTDVTAHVRTRQRLRDEADAALRARDEFSSIATHEIRTPVSVLGLKLDTLLRQASRSDLLRSEAVVPALNVARRQVDRLNALLESLLEAAYLERGHLRLHRESIELGALVRETVTALDDRLRGAGCVVTVHAHEPVRGDWDRVRLEQVVRNLVDNAMKYGGGEPIEVSVARIDGHAILRVKDRGRGIAAGDQARVFERFERATGEYRNQSLGLGLFIVREIVRGHGGTIRVESTLGEGATFEVRLPVHPVRANENESLSRR